MSPVNVNDLRLFKGELWVTHLPKFSCRASSVQRIKYLQKNYIESKLMKVLFIFFKFPCLGHFQHWPAKFPSLSRLDRPDVFCHRIRIYIHMWTGSRLSVTRSKFVGALRESKLPPRITLTPSAHENSFMKPVIQYFLLARYPLARWGCCRCTIGALLHQRVAMPPCQCRWSSYCSSRN